MTPAHASPARRIFRDALWLILLAAVPALLAGWLHPKRPVWSWTKPAVTEVTLSDAKRWPAPVLWVDARTEEAYQRQHVPGAILLNEGDWEKQLPGFLAAWQPGAQIIVYCDSQACDASQAVALRLQRELKLNEIHVLQGGWATWLKSNP